MSKPALGRGLSALLGGKNAPAGSSPFAAPAKAPATAPAGPAGPPPPAAPAPETAPVPSGPRVETVPVTRLRPSALQPRRDFPAESLAELAASIREQGILQPLVVRRQGEFLELIAGERRWRAAQLAGLTEVPVVEREVDDTTALEWMLVENLQREGLNPIDEAHGYAELMERFHLTQETTAQKVGKSRTAVANALRFLRLPTEVQEWMKKGALSAGHAKVLLGLPTPDLQRDSADRVVREGLSVRQSEELVARLTTVPAPASGEKSASPAVPTRDPHVAALEDKLRQRLGTKVALRYRQGKGQIEIRFFSDDELERLLDIVGVQVD